MTHIAHDSSGPPAAARPASPSPSLRRAAAGDRAAQQALLVEHIERIRRRVGRLVGCAADVDDLVQQSCVELLRSLARYRGDASMTLWVDRITTHVVFKHFRTTRRRRKRVTLAEDVDRECPMDSERRLEWRAGVTAARAVVAALKPERRIVFLLVAVEGRTLPETAAMLDLSLSAAKSRYLRARREVDRRVAGDRELCALLGRAGEPS